MPAPLEFGQREVAQHPDCRHAARDAKRNAALPARPGGADRQVLVKTLIDLFIDGNNMSPSFT